MYRWIVLLAAVALTACAPAYHRAPHDSGYREVYAGGSSYYAPAEADRGDYYYARYEQPSYSAYDWYEYPAYYSLFWRLQHGFVDPYWHPGFYYGVTYFPRSYFSVSLYGGRYRPHFALAYSPYRRAWVDSYYDWYPYYRYNSHHHHNRYYAPRYGNPRNEAERLSHLSRTTPNFARGERGLPASRSSYGGQRSGRDYVGNPARDADYRGRGGSRQDPTRNGSQRDRIDPRISGFNRPGSGPAAAERRSNRVDPRIDDRRDRYVERSTSPRMDPARTNPARNAVRSDQIDRRVTDRAAIRAPDRSSERAPSDPGNRRQIVTERNVTRADRGYNAGTPQRQQSYGLGGFRGGDARNDSRGGSDGRQVVSTPPREPQADRRSYAEPRIQSRQEAYGAADGRRADLSRGDYGRGDTSRSDLRGNQSGQRAPAPAYREPAYRQPAPNPTRETRPVQDYREVRSEVREERRDSRESNREARGELRQSRDESRGDRDDREEPRRR